MHTLPRNSSVHKISSSSLVLGGLNLHSAICFAKQRVRSELTNKLGNNVTSVDEYSKIVTAQQLGDRIMHILHISRLKHNSWIEKPYSNDNLKLYYDENRIFPIEAILKHKQVVCMRRKMPFTI